MEQQATFQTSVFGGFNKKAVLQYIDQLSAQNQAVLQELNQKLAQMEECRANLSGAVESLNTQVEGLKKDLEERNSQAREMHATIEQLNAEIARQKALAEERERELRVQQDKCRQLTLRAESLEYKGRKYDEAVDQIGGALLDARRSADDILKTAQQQADQFTATAMESVRGIAQEIETFKHDVSSLRELLRSSLTDLGSRLDAMDFSIDTLEAAVQATSSRHPVVLEEKEGQPVLKEQVAEAQKPEPSVREKAAASEFFW